MTSLSLVDNDRPFDWDVILEQTRLMLDAAGAGDWERVVVLERERHGRIKRFFSDVPAPHEADWVRRGIEVILELDGRLLTLSQSGKTEASTAVIDIRRKAEANRAYAAHTA